MTASVEQLVSVVYVSSAVRAFTEADTLAMLTQARRNNERCGLTGMLLYRDGNFLQVLEGPEAAVKDTLQKIERDERHKGILVLKVKPIPERDFAEWTMAFRDISLQALKNVEGYSPFMETSFDSEEFRSKPDFAHRMLLQFKARLR